MTGLVAMPLESGGVVVVEMDHIEGGVVKARKPGQIAAEAAQTLEAALDSVTPVAQSILAKLRRPACRRSLWSSGSLSQQRLGP